MLAGLACGMATLARKAKARVIELEQHELNLQAVEAVGWQHGDFALKWLVCCVVRLGLAVVQDQLQRGPHSCPSQLVGGQVNTPQTEEINCVAYSQPSSP